MFKKIYLLLLVAAISAPAFAQTKTITLSGKLVNYNNQVTLFDISEYGRLLPEMHHNTIVPDSNGSISIIIKLTKPGYFMLGRNHLYLSPGDKLVISSDAKKSPETTTFSGRGADANNYLTHTQFSNMGAYVYAGTNLKATPQESYDYIMQAAAARKVQLDQLKNVSSEFKRLETARIKAEVLVSLHAAIIYARYTKAIANKDSFVVAFNKIAEPVKKQYLNELTASGLLSVSTYRDVLSSVIENAPASANVTPLKEFQRASALSTKMLTEHDKAKLAAFQKNIDSLKNAGYKTALTSSLKELLEFGVGDTAVDFKGIDINGKPIKLSDLKGKVICVDFWATWCGPCLKEMPALETLKQKYKGDDRVVFVSLSIDQTPAIDLWKTNVKDRNADGYQWHADGAELLAYHITGIPRMILIDQDFKMADMNAPLPSQPAVTKAIDALLK